MCIIDEVIRISVHVSVRLIKSKYISSLCCYNCRQFLLLSPISLLLHTFIPPYSTKIQKNIPWRRENPLYSVAGKVEIFFFLPLHPGFSDWESRFLTLYADSFSCMSSNLAPNLGQPSLFFPCCLTELCVYICASLCAYVCVYICMRCIFSAPGHNK